MSRQVKKVNISDKEDKSNKVSSWSNTTTDTHYPSEKLVKDSLDGKANSTHTHSQYLTEHQDLSNYVTTDDNRLSDARTPTSHTHTKSQITDFPTLPSASSTVPSADTTNGSYGSGTTYARSNHTHPKSSLYAEASHTHSQYLTSHQDITGKEDKSNKVTGVLSNSNTDTEYPSAKSVVDTLDDFNGYVIESFATKSLLDYKENMINKSSSITTDTGSTSKYPTVKAVEDYAQPKGNYLTQHQSLANYVQKSNTSGLLKNDGSVDTTQYLSSLPSHNHDDRYYTESEVDTALNGKANSSHTHTKSQITDFPSIPSKTSELTNDSGFLTSHQDITGKEDKSNKVTSISSSSTDTQYPSAKAVDTYVTDSIESKLAKSDTKTLDSQYMAYGIYNSWRIVEVFGGQEMANEVTIGDDRIEYMNFEGLLKFTNNTSKKLLLTLTLDSGNSAENYYSFDKINHTDLSSTPTTITLESDEFVYLYCDSGNSVVLYSVRSDKNSIGTIRFRFNRFYRKKWNIR